MKSQKVPILKLSTAKNRREAACLLRRPRLLVRFRVGEIIRLCIGESTLPANVEGASSDKLGQTVKHAEIDQNGDRESGFRSDLSE
jgi:hypothetical protein